MPQPTYRDLHVDQPLTNISIGYKNANYIADEIFPIVPVMKKSDIIPQKLLGESFRNSAQLRAPGTKSARGGYGIKQSDTYICQEYAWAEEIADEERDNADSPWNLDQEATFEVTEKLMLAREYQFSSNMFTTSVWGSDKTGGTDFTAWSSYATSSPLTDIEGWKDTIMASGVGTEPNTFVMGNQVWIQLKWHPDVIDSVKYTQVGVASEQLFSNLTGILNVLIGKAVYTSSPEVATTAYGTTGAGTDQDTLISFTRIWGKHALLLYRPAAASLRTPAAGYTFVWNRVPNAIQYIKRHRDDERGVDIIDGHSWFVHKKLVANAGLFASGAVA
jgi:hypothetical protein